MPVSVVAYSSGDSSLETRPHVESEGALLTCVTDNMDKLEPTKVFRLLRKEQLDELTAHTIHSAVVHLACALFQHPYLVRHVSDLNELPSRVHLNDLDVTRSTVVSDPLRFRCDVIFRPWVLARAGDHQESEKEDDTADLINMAERLQL